MLGRLKPGGKQALSIEFPSGTTMAGLDPGPETPAKTAKFKKFSEAFSSEQMHWGTGKKHVETSQRFYSRSENEAIQHGYVKKEELKPAPPPRT